MDFTPPMELDRRSITDWGQVRGSTLNSARLVELSSWMMVLGTIRLICMCADYVNSFLETWRIEPISFRMVGEFIRDNQPLLAVCAAWPLFLAITLRRTGWLELLPAASLTFLFLSIGGVLGVAAELSYAGGNGGTIGSFHLTRRAFVNPTVADLSLTMIGAIQLALELAAAVRGFFLIPGFRETAPAELRKQERSRRARLGRLAVYIAFGYLGLMARLPVWSTYLELLNNSPVIREFVIRNDIRRVTGTPGSSRFPRRDLRLQAARAVLTAASHAAQAGRFAVASENYQRVIAFADPASTGLLRQSYRSMATHALNNLAWLQATCPHTELRNPSESVRNARRATELEPEDGTFWNTLGAAYYRNGDWSEANRAFSRSMELRQGGDSFDWFFLSLVQLKLGHKDEAIRWYEKAVGWFHQTLPSNQELYLLQVEAALELELPRPAPPPQPHNSMVSRRVPIEPSSVRLRNRVRSLDPPRSLSKKTVPVVTGVGRSVQVRPVGANCWFRFVLSS